jgi:periplasmic copper chaperone A
MQSRLLALAAAMVLSSAAAIAESGIEISEVWARATPGGARTAAVYVTLTASAGDRLTSASTPVAQKAEFHSMTMDSGVMKMRQFDAIDLPPGQKVTLKPGGYHIMLTGLAKPLAEGESFPLTLDFAKTGARQVTVSVQKVGAMAPGGETGHGATMPDMGMPIHR